MILFQNDGHLTDEALRATIEEALDEMSRLEVSEHLSFCDGCLERYTALLTDDVLLTPVQPIAPPVLSRVRKRAVGILFNRYTTYAAAACLALTLWGAGVFTGIGSGEELREQARRDFSAQAAAAPSHSFMMQASDFLGGISRRAYDALNSAIMEHKPQERDTQPPASAPVSKP